MTRTAVQLNDQAEMRKELQKVEQANAAYERAYAALEQMNSTAKGWEIRGRIAAAAAQAKPLTDKVIALALDKQDQQASALLMLQAGPATQKWQDVMDEYIALQKERNHAQGWSAWSASSNSMPMSARMRRSAACRPAQPMPRVAPRRTPARRWPVPPSAAPPLPPAASNGKSVNLAITAIIGSVLIHLEALR